jgi:hypothetical protein
MVKIDVIHQVGAVPIEIRDRGDVVTERALDKVQAIAEEQLRLFDDETTDTEQPRVKG